MRELPAWSGIVVCFTMCALWVPSGWLTTCEGSSRGRGSRAAGWFSDYIQDQNDTKMESFALEGGIKGWATAGEEYVKKMTEYDPSVWEAETK